ncbi:DUF6789 family protein [Haloquadratum walsbyi]|jgi:hypothetical protein|uniref:Histidine kinase n=1 Tax=Haloquadratum walsbyi J07HQW2 TaxID=1238425 RepID=U1MW17_9EURY|nr:DUF6789 family protein [Haloquadratum walsbyi]ERG94619.1 MAG: hypothetical protein J07HQW2_01055 [Haloquadratum walsbyi J07HQW2]
MSTQAETANSSQANVSDGKWKAGVIGGIAGAVVMGAAIIMMNTPTLAVAIPSLYTLAPPANVGLGLFVHLSHGAVLGVIFAALTSLGQFSGLGARVGIGALWGVITWAGFAALVMPVWLSVIGSPASPPFPNFAPPSLLWHLIYGVVLGVIYDVSEDMV